MEDKKEDSNSESHKNDNSENISTEELTDRGKKNQKRQIAQIDIETEKIIAIYTSIADAYRILGKQHSGHIASVCKGQRKTAYGFK